MTAQLIQRSEMWMKRIMAQRESQISECETICDCLFLKWLQFILSKIENCKIKKTFVFSFLTNRIKGIVQMSCIFKVELMWP